MKRPLNYVLAIALAMGLASSTLAAAPGAPSLISADLVTEVMPWGEAVTAVRLEYSEEVYSGEVTTQMPSAVVPEITVQKYRLSEDRMNSSGRAITSVYVNDSGKKDEATAYGKYVFINLSAKDIDPLEFRSQIAFDPVTHTRGRLPSILVSQLAPVKTRSGNIVGPVSVRTSGEISIGVDDYTSFTYRNPETGHDIKYHLFIPAGYEVKQTALKNLPLIVHFPSGDYSYADWTGKYRGALFTHHDALYWSDPDSQAQHPAFVVTVGGPTDTSWNSTNFNDSEMQKSYLQAVKEIMNNFNVDISRVYAVSLAGGTVPMWATIFANPNVFAAQITTSYDPYHVYRDKKRGEDQFARLLQTLPGWYFAGLTDPTGTGVLGPADTRLKGERLRDIARLMIDRGIKVDIAYGTDGELMWNGLLRGEKASKLAIDQIARAKEEKAASLVTLYIPNTVMIHGHWVWDATYSNAEVRNWLFQQSRSKSQSY